tara:strand:+ start:8003 stop:12964 length:4962 start_codon:yes stop_codon:yes gene_type:complete
MLRLLSILSPKNWTILTTLLTLSFLFISSSSFAQFAGGSGTQADPYQISTLQQLQDMKNNLGAHYILINDINAAETKSWNSGDGFEPIGSGSSNSFTGNFNGQHFTIDSLFIDRSSYVGLFGYTQNNTISNVNLTNVDIAGLSTTGSIAGETRSTTLTNISVTGRVSGSNATGGLVGRALGSVNNSFADVRVTGSTYSGGLVGRGAPNITNSYALGNVSASNRDAGGLIALSGGVITNSYSKGNVTSGGTKGGLVGSTSGDGAKTVNSFWDIETSGLTNSAGGEGKTTAEMTSPSTYIQGGWDIYEVWATLTDSNDGYPVLRAFEDFQVSANAPIASSLSISGDIEVDSTLTLSYVYFDADSDPEYVPEIQWYRSTDEAGTDRVLITGAVDTTYTITGADRAHFISVEITPHDVTSAGEAVFVSTTQSVANIFAGGLGTKEDPFQIETVEQLQNINTGLDSYYILNNYIDASATSTWNGDLGFIPLGNDNVTFSGGFDGANFIISGLTINRPSEEMIGLFGVTSSTAEITNTMISSADLTGDTIVGTIVGKNGGSISKSSAESIVIQSNGYIGGLVGENTGSISESYSIGEIEGGIALGGLVGHNNSGSIINSFAKVHVNGNSQSGGLVGLNDKGSITNSYSIGAVDNGTSTFGGLVGEVIGGSVTVSFWDTETSGQATSAAGTGKTTSQVKTIDTFSNWDLKAVWGLHPFYGDGYPFLRAFATPTTNAPVVSNLSILGTVEVGNTLSVSYSFTDTDNDPEYLSEIQWYRSKDASGAAKEIIEGADSVSYVIQEEDKAYFLSVVVTPSDVFNQGESVEKFATEAVPSSVFAGGFGSEEFPYQISTLEHLQAMNTNLSAHYELINDIDATTTSDWNSGAGFVPIAFPNGRFEGSLNGNNFEINGLFINRPDDNDVGLFSTIRGGSVSNLGLTNVNITGDRSTGGLVGDLDGDSITNVFVTGSVTGTWDVGGLIGSTFTATVVRDSYSSAKVIGTSEVGGLVGSSYITIINSYATGDITATSLYSGGLVGSNRGSITKSYSTGNINGSNTSGGLVGYNKGNISYSYSRGNVHSTFTAGGFVGSNDSTIVNSYSTGAVTSNFDPSGFIAYAYSNSKVISSFWDKESSGVNIAVDNGSSDGITGFTTAEMYQRATYTNWDFATTWSIDEGFGYPFHQESDYNTLAITGTEGWRLFASPVEGATLDSLLSTIRTQGFAGTNVTTDTSNVYLWNADTQSWEVPTSMAQPLANGQGFAVYVFADDDNDGTPETFPKQLRTSLPPHIGTTNANLAYTTPSDGEVTGWNLVGNPYAETIDWDAPTGWTKNNISNTFYVWSDTAGAGQGAYLNWNGITGTLPDGKIAPWQGFWIKATAENPELVFTDSVKASGGVFQKEAPVSQIEFILSDGTFFSKANILMLEESLASQFLDEYDAFALTSLNDTSLSISTSFLDGPPMSTQAMPFQVGTEYSFDIHLEALNVPNTLTLSVEKENLGLVEVKLVNTETDEVSYISDMGIITLDFDFEGSSFVSTSLREPTSPFEYISIDSTTTTKYKVFVSHHGLSAEDELGIPNLVELQQNYPNPFNPSTSINFGVPTSGKVTLEVFDVLGRKVATLINGENRVAGRHTVNFDAKNLASGMYIYRLQAGSSILTKRLTLIK